MRRTRASVGGTTGRPSVQPRSNMASISSSRSASSTRRQRSTDPPKRTRSSSATVGVDRQRAASGPQLRKVGAEVGHAGELLPTTPGASRRCARPLVAVLDAQQGRDGLDVVVPGHGQVRVVDGGRAPAGNAGSSCAYTVSRSRPSPARRGPVRRAGRSGSRVHEATIPSGRGRRSGRTLTPYCESVPAGCRGSRRYRAWIVGAAGYVDVLRECAGRPRARVTANAPVRRQHVVRGGGGCRARLPRWSSTWERACARSARAARRRHLPGPSLVTHLHWDHVQGLPFFSPILRPGAEFDVYGPAPDDGRSRRRSTSSCGRRSSR